MREFYKKNKRAALSGLASLLVLLTAIILWFLYQSAPHRVHSPNIPALPDLAGQPKVLIDYLQSVNEQALKSPSSDQAIADLGMAYQSNFFYDEAKVCYERAAELNPREWRWIYYSALIDEELGDTKATIEKLNHVLELNPEVSQAWFWLGDSYLKTNAYQDAEKAFHQVLSLK
jgi:tetratricopeptide (TPR) repeat protein